MLWSTGHRNVGESYVSKWLRPSELTVFSNPSFDSVSTFQGVSWKNIHHYHLPSSSPSVLFTLSFFASSASFFLKSSSCFFSSSSSTWSFLASSAFWCQQQQKQQQKYNDNNKAFDPREKLVFEPWTPQILINMGQGSTLLHWNVLCIDCSLYWGYMECSLYTGHKECF